MVNSLIRQETQVFFTGAYQNPIKANRITTGNELYKEAIAAFTRPMDIDTLYDYCMAVKSSGDALLRSLSYKDMKGKIDSARREQLIELNVVSREESAFWLIDYWCNKNVPGLIKMPLSRHWIMHTEAALRIRNKLLLTGGTKQ